MTNASPSYLDNFFSVDLSLGGARVSKGLGLNFDATQFDALLNTNTQQIDVSLKAGGVDAYIKGTTIGGQPSMVLARWDIDPDNGPLPGSLRINNADGSDYLANFDNIMSKATINGGFEVTGASQLTGGVTMSASLSVTSGASQSISLTCSDGTMSARGKRLSLAGSATSPPGGPGGDGEAYIYATTKTRLAVGSLIGMTVEDASGTLKLSYGPGATVAIPFAVDVGAPVADQVSDIFNGLKSIGLAIEA